MLKKSSVLIAVALVLLASAAVADARRYIAIDNVRSQAETLDGQPGSLSFDFTESGLPPGSESTYCFFARASVTTVGREFRPDSHGGRWFATMRRLDHTSGSLLDYFRSGPGACASSATADSSGTAHGHFTSEWPHLRMLPFLAQWTVSSIEVVDVTHGASGFAGCPTTLSHYISNGCHGAMYRTYCNGFRTQFVETGAVPDLAECSADRVSGGSGPGYQRPQTPPEVLAADDAAMWNALKLRDQMKYCYSGTRDYAACATQITAASSGLPIGGARGQVEITQAQQPWDPGLPAPFPGYTIVAHSLSGTDFTHYVPAAGASATLAVFTRCSKPHRGFCGPEGFWSDLWGGAGYL